LHVGHWPFTGGWPLDEQIHWPPTQVVPATGQLHGTQAPFWHISFVAQQAATSPAMPMQAVNGALHWQPPAGLHRAPSGQQTAAAPVPQGLWPLRQQVPLAH
jgi:hypothetical protein